MKNKTFMPSKPEDGGDRLYVNGRPTPRAPTFIEIKEEEGGTSMSAHSERSCHWPVGTDASGMKMCGKTIAQGAYCEEHAARAYSKSASAKRKFFWGK